MSKWLMAMAAAFIGVAVGVVFGNRPKCVFIQDDWTVSRLDHLVRDLRSLA